MESQSASIATSMDIWQRNARRRKRKIQGNASNVKKWGILQKIVKRNSQ